MPLILFLSIAGCISWILKESQCTLGWVCNYSTQNPFMYMESLNNYLTRMKCEISLPGLTPLDCSASL